ncbi:MAG: hypothetical protein U0002_15695 [Thermoanaerobaculia bacterium]
MTRTLLSGLLVASLLGLAPAPLPAQQADLLATPIDPGTDLPDAMVPENELQPFRDLATRLSQDRSWLTPELLQKLDERSLWLSEVFDRAPQAVEVDGQLYRITLEAYGSAWRRLDPAKDRYFVYLGQEIDDRLGADRVAGFEAGSPSVFFAKDFDSIAGFGLSLSSLTEAELPAAGVGEKRQPSLAPSRTGLESGIELGQARPHVLERARPGDAALAEPSLAQRAVCPREIAPSACVAGKPTCSTTGYTPFFVLDALYIRQDHEPIGSPEIELYPMRLDLPTAAGGQTNIQTGMIFDGRTILDFAGQSVYLPDVNNKNTWYNISGGMALFPTNNGLQFSATLVDDDNQAGKLVRDGRVPLNIRLLQSSLGLIRILIAPRLDALNLINSALGLIDLIGILNNADDLFEESLGIENSVFCDVAVNQSFPYSITLTTTEWDLKGHFSCINPTCTPPPPPPSCTGSGGSCLSGSECCSGLCDTNGGILILGTCQ